MQVKKNLMLYFPKSETERPIVYHLVKDYNLMVNLFRAKVTPEEEGYLVLEVTGEEDDITRAIAFLGSFNESQKGLRWERERCTSCGNCLTHCPTVSLHIVDPITREVEFDPEACIECLSCVANCPFGACSSVF
jgi:ferredoxin